MARRRDGPTIENDNIATGSVYSLRYESSGPVTGGVASNGDEDVLCGHRPGTGKDLESMSMS